MFVACKHRKLFMDFWIFCRSFVVLWLLVSSHHWNHRMLTEKPNNSTLKSIVQLSRITKYHPNKQLSKYQFSILLFFDEIFYVHWKSYWIINICNVYSARFNVFQFKKKLQTQIVLVHHTDEMLYFFLLFFSFSAFVMKNCFVNIKTHVVTSKNTIHPN